MGGVWPRPRCVHALTLGLLVLAIAAAEAHAAPVTRRCTSTRLPFDDSRCLRVSVPLDRSGALPGTIRLLVAIKPPTSGTANETILALAGGPGQAAVPLLDELSFALPQSALRSRQLVTFDQRGMGSSGRLSCPGLSQALTDLSPGVRLDRAVMACATHLGAARTHYTTADSVADIEAVRAALGVDKLTLWGTSYGTKVALAYASAYPQHVARLLLDSALLPEGVDPFRRLTVASIPRVMREICAHGGCPFTHDAGDDLNVLAARLAHGPLHGPYVGGDGRARPALLTGPSVLRLLLAEDVDPLIRAQLPGAVRSALDGDPALLLRLAAVPDGGVGGEEGGSNALYLATTCEDGGGPWAPGTPIADRAAAVGSALAAIPPAQLAPFGAQAVRSLGFADLCRAWPESPIAQPLPPLPDVPALILSGDEDLRTPRREAFALAARMPHAQVLDVPQTGHSTLESGSTCVRTAVGAFLADRPVQPCARPKSELAPFAPLPRSFAAVRPLPGFPPRVGRTLGAVGETLTALVLQALDELVPRLALDPHARVLRVGGLRGGTLAISPRTSALDGYCVVPGVTLTAASDADTAVVHVGGWAAARGWLRSSGAWVEGRLGGRRVRVRSERLLGSLGGGALIASASASGRPPLPLPAIPGLLGRLIAAEEASAHAG